MTDACTCPPWTDEFEPYLDRALRNPVFRREFRRAARRLDNGHTEPAPVKANKRPGWRR